MEIVNKSSKHYDNRENKTVSYIANDKKQKTTWKWPKKTVNNVAIDNKSSKQYGN